MGRSFTMDNVLILGNGISRLLYHQQIMDYEGEVWGCNYAYLEYPDKIRRLAGHVVTMREAAEYAKENGLDLKVYGGNQGSFPEYFCKYTCPPEFMKDSGTTLVAQALAEGRPRIDVTGFDLGGPDVGSPRHWRLDKSGWIRRWRLIYERYRESWTVHFWGRDHLPVITTTDGAEYWGYAGNYKRTYPHIDDDRYIALHYALYGIPEKLNPEKPMDEVEIMWLEPPHEGKIMTRPRWYGEIEAKRGHCKITKSPYDEEIFAQRMELEAKVDEIAESLPLKSLQLMAERRGLGNLDGTDRRGILQLIGESDRV